MSKFEWITVALSVTSVVFIPLIILAIRVAMRQAKTQEQIGQLISGLRSLVESKESDHKEISKSIHDVVSEQTKIHREMYEQMRIDRDATDRRLRYIEEYWMKRGQGNP